MHLPLDTDSCALLPDTGSGLSLGLLAGASLAVLVGVLLLAVQRGGARRDRVQPAVVATLAAVALVLGVLQVAASATPADAACDTSSTSPSSFVDPTSLASPDPTVSPSSSPSATTTASPTTSPTATPTTTATAAACLTASDKSSTTDTDGDGVVDACDLDSDNDGVPDSVEDVNHDGRFENDDVDGDLLVIGRLGDRVSSYLDLDSDNDAVLDLFESGLSDAQIDQLDADHDGVIDASVAFGTNGLADALETSPDSGVLAHTIRNTDGDDKVDFLDLMSNGSDYDLYEIGRSDLDLLGAGFISTFSDADHDGIQAVVDTADGTRGAPGSPLP